MGPPRACPRVDCPDPAGRVRARPGRPGRGGGERIRADAPGSRDADRAARPGQPWARAPGVAGGGGLGPRRPPPPPPWPGSPSGGGGFPPCPPLFGGARGPGRCLRGFRGGPLDRLDAGDPVLGQGDSNLANFLWDGTEVRIVDFEDSGPSDRAFELADLVEHISAWPDASLPADVVLGSFGLTAAKQVR